jgi:uncharacterized protein (DUF58 family)
VIYNLKKNKRSVIVIIIICAFILSLIPGIFAKPLVYILRIGIFVAIVQLYLKSVYLKNRFFVVLSIIISGLISGFFIPFLFPFAQASILIFIVLCILDMLVLYNPNTKIDAERILPKLFSLGDENKITLRIKNNSAQNFNIHIIDELPEQFQKRDFSVQLNLSSLKEEKLVYELRPKIRGEYFFRNINIYISSFLGLVERRIIFEQNQMIPVYPSIIQMKKFELIALSRISTFPGVKKVRKIGQSYEFEQIRNYVKGDDYRSINWKATSRKNDVMVNQYEDERSQQIFSVIDKGRSMKMPFEGLSLMDYAINTALVISNVALLKHDKVGLLSFSDKIGTTIKPESGPRQLRLIIEALYKEKERNLEANFELLYQASRQFIRRRCLMFLYTNFESFSAMQRVLPILRKINHSHLLVVIFFENTEIKDFAEKDASNTEGIYNKTIALKFVEEKNRIVQEMRQYGIQTILTRPEDLSVNTLNKYLELKAKRMI